MQLRNFIQKAKFDPAIDDNYFARTQKKTDDNSDDLLSNDIAIYIVVSYCVGLFLSIGITITLLIIYHNTKHWDEKLENLSKINNANKFSQAKIFSVAITMLTINLYILFLDGAASYAWGNKESDIKESGTLSSLHVIVPLIDVLAFIYCVGLCTFGLCSQFELCLKDRLYKLYTFLALSTLGPSLSVVIHLPYILIAYLNDATYASSIFIYYTVTVFILFGALDLSYGTFMGALNQNTSPLYNKCGKKGIIITFAIFILIFTIAIVVLMGMITATLVLIPISKALSDAPNRLFGFYQIIIVLIGAYYAYKKLFHKNPSLESVVEETEENITGKSWKGLSNNEKLKDNCWKD